MVCSKDALEYSPFPMEIAVRLSISSANWKELVYQEDLRFFGQQVSIRFNQNANGLIQKLKRGILIGMDGFKRLKLKKRICPN
jgi:hypothetical protein